MSVSPLLPHKQVHQYHLSRVHIYALIDDIYFSLSDISLHTIGSKFIHLLTLFYNVYFLFKRKLILCKPQSSHGLPDSSVGKESTCNAGNPGSVPGWGRSPGEGIGYPHQGFPGGSVGKESVCNAGDLGLILGLGRFSGE